MLKHPVPSPSRRFVGLALALALVAGGGTLAWAAQPAVAVPAGKIGLQLQVRIDGGPEQTLTSAVAPGEAHAFDVVGGGEHWRIDTTVQHAAKGGYDLSATLVRDGKVVAEPRLLFDAAGAGIQVGDEIAGGFDGIAIEVMATERAAD